MDLSLKLCTTSATSMDRDRDTDTDLSSKLSTITTSMDGDVDVDVDLSLKLCTSTNTSKDRDLYLVNEKNLKPCTTSSSLSDSLPVDRFTTLPVELLIQILSLLPTKDVAATCVLSKKMMTQVFPWVTTLDLNDSPISHCLEHPNRIESFPSFVTFVNSVLRTHQSQYLTRFRLGVATEYKPRFQHGCGYETHLVRYGKGCFPDVNSLQINAWISFPLIHCGLRELDLCIWLRGKSDDCQLAPEIFTIETLEVLKLNVNLGFDRASAMPSFCLPKLKLLLLGAFLPKDDFLTRLVSSCPLLEDLTVKGRCMNPQFTRISSPSLRRMCLDLDNVAPYSERSNSDFVLINTPNLEYLDYTDNLAYQYFITRMERLVEVKISIEDVLIEEAEVSVQTFLGLIGSLSNVQHLALNDACTGLLDFDELKDQLPVFPKLKCLKLHHIDHYDKLLLPFLHCSPVLETLVFPKGLTNFPYDSEHRFIKNKYLLEREFCRTTQAIIPSCCRHHLKKIVINVFFGYERDINLIQFFLRHALVLEELVLSPISVADITADHVLTFKSTLPSLPRASPKCSILWNETIYVDNPFPRDTTG